MNNVQKTTINEIDPVVLESVNYISGAQATLFWDALYGMSESIAVVKNTRTVLAALYDGNYFEEALMLLRTYYELLGAEWSTDLEIVETIPEIKEPFLYEFLLDAEDIILDIKYE